MKILPYYHGDFLTIPLLPPGKHTAKDIRYVDRKDIKYVRAYTDSAQMDGRYMDFVNLDDKDLWRILATKDSISIYDDYTPDDPPFGYRMILMEKGKKEVTIYRHTWHDSTEVVTPETLQFINKRYQTNFDTSHFKDEWDMIHYILDRESSPGTHP